MPCDADVAEHEFPGATLAELAAVRAIRRGLDASSAVGTTQNGGDLYQIDIAEHRMTLENGSWTKKTPFVSVACRAEYNSGPIAGPVTFVSW